MWLRLLGRDAVQQQAVTELLRLPATDPRRSKALQLLVAWKVTIEVSGMVEQEQNLMTTLSQVYLEWEQQTKQQAKQEGIEQGIEQGIERERSLVLRLLVRQVGDIPDEVRSQVTVLPLPQLEALAEALLGFSELNDLLNWLATQQS